MREKGLCSAGSRTFAEITRFMNLAAILLLGIGLSLDTFAVSLTLGFVSERTTRREKVRFLIVIGLFHFLMILAGWLFGANVSRLIADYDHWIAFFLLAFLGAKMIREGLSAVQDDEVDCDLLSLRNTLMKRPDLLEKAELSQKDRWLVAQMKAELEARDGNDSNAVQTDGETDRK